MSVAKGHRYWEILSVSRKHEHVFDCGNVEGDKAGDEREKQRGNAGARSANRQDRMEQKKKKSGKKGVEKKLFAREGA